MKELVIDRSKWARGGRNGSSALLNGDYKMCCLGFLALSCGYTEEEIAEELAPNDTIKTINKWAEGLIDGERNTPWTEVAMLINDNEDLKDQQREHILTYHFKSVGILVEFVGPRYESQKEEL